MSFYQNFNLKADNGKTYSIRIDDYGDGRIITSVIAVEPKLKNNLDDLKHDLNKLESYYDFTNNIDMEALLKYLRSNANALEEIVKKLDT